MRCCNGATPPKPQTLVPHGGGLILAATPLQYEREMQREKISQIILKMANKLWKKLNILTTNCFVTIFVWGFYFISLANHETHSMNFILL